MVVQHNIASMNANRYYNINNSGLAKSLEKLSSGYAINRAGDNAAGLAVSEKMRSQIGGLTQGVKNAQDGISMIQTYEGALTETDSILQRMKTLADQSANGTYQDDVDREAIQLEFNQLNDELDQIADTDFNGVVMLNGGKMADGLEQVNGKFNYKDRVASQQAAAAADAKALAEAQDIGDGSIIDDSKYSKRDADKIWNDLGLNVADYADPDDPNAAVDLNVTFTFDGTNWKATGVTDGDGNAIQVSAEKLDKLTTTRVDGSTTTSGKGGFTVNGTSINAIFDTTDSGKYDQLTINFQNVNADNRAPTNIGIDEDSVTAAITNGTMKNAPSITIGTIKDSEMTADIKAAYDALNESEITLTYENGAIKGTGGYTTNKATVAQDTAKGIVGGNIAISDAGVITYTPTGGTAVTLGTITAGTLNGNTAEGTIKFGVNVKSYNYVDQSVIGAESKATGDASKATSGMFDAAASGGVSKADSWDAATATLTYTDTLTLQAGARTKDSVEFTFEYASEGLGELKADLNCSSTGLGTKSLSLRTQESANRAIDKIDNAINKVSMVRATFGATQNRLEHKIDNMNVTKENITSAESRIRDTDVSEEMANFTKNQILSQASQSMLAQANSLPQNVLQLLG